MDPPFLELQGYVMKRLLVFGDDHDSRRVLVQAMDNSRTPLPADALEIRAVMEEGIH